ncbi:MAG: M56 family metallopeptidase, partial [Planctomycetes bacterium]|nr:M56 family metallopeptidase [Planctomycetota bacterium]
MQFSGPFFGAVLLAAVVALKSIHLRRKLKQTAIPVDAELLSLVSRLKQKLGIRRRVQVLVTSEPVGPAVFGFLRPVVVLPQSLLAEVSAEAIEPIVAHELVHVRRWDSAAGLLQVLAQLVWWFHPLVWWANRQTSRERERCCDEEVVTGLGCLPTFYARSLLDVLELKRRLRSIFAFPGIRPVEITSKRMEDIMQRSDYFHRRTPRWCWGLALISAALILPGAGLMFEPSVAASAQDARKKQQEAKSQNAVSSVSLRVDNSLPVDQKSEKTPVEPSSGFLHRLPEDGTWVKYDWEDV